MSAIAGVWRQDGRPVCPAELRRIGDSLAHRGTDRAAIWFQEAIGLVCCCLSTDARTPAEQLPHRDPGTGLVVTGDLRLDNREELACMLGLEGEVGDGRLALEAYRRWETECARHLLGDFTFAVWDPRCRRLFCARDPMGTKALFYYQDAGVFAFSSEIKGLLCIHEVPSELNEHKLADYLAAVADDQQSTFYKGVLRLPPAHVLVVEPGKSRLRRYWSLDPGREIKLRSDREYAEALRDMFTRAVRRRLRRAYPVGAALSGGLDSSSIACTAQAILAERGQPLHTFSAVFPSLVERGLRSIDESEYISAVLEWRSFRPHFCEADTLSPLQDLDLVLRHVEEPFLAPNLYMHWGLYRTAQREGVRVFLDGLDGDTAVSHGLSYLTELARCCRWLRLTREAGALARRWGSRQTARSVLWRFGLRPLVPEPIARLWRDVSGAGRQADDQSIVLDEFARRTRLVERLEQQRERRRPKGAREDHCESLQAGLLSAILELAERAAAAWGLEARYPFFDRELIEFCVALPGAQKLSDGWTRMVFRRAMEGAIPADVQWRFAKADLGANFRLRMLECDREVLEDAVYRQPEYLQPYVDLTKLRALYRRYTEHPLRAAQEALVVHRVAVLHRWLRCGGPTAAKACARTQLTISMTADMWRS